MKQEKPFTVITRIIHSSRPVLSKRSHMFVHRSTSCSAGVCREIFKYSDVPFYSQVSIFTRVYLDLDLKSKKSELHLLLHAHRSNL